MKIKLIIDDKFADIEIDNQLINLCSDTLGNKSKYIAYELEPYILAVLMLGVDKDET